MAVMLSDYIVFFVFIGILLVFSVFVIVRQVVGRMRSSGSGIGGAGMGRIKRLFKRERNRERSFSFKSSGNEGHEGDEVNINKV